MAGGAVWRDRTQFALGAWIMVVNALGAFAGPPWHYLVMSVLGGGGFLLAGCWRPAAAGEPGGGTRPARPRPLSPC